MHTLHHVFGTYTQDKWIIDTGDHMCMNHIQLHDTKKKPYPIHVYLPNSHFNVNLIFVSQLTRDLNYSFVFHQNFCSIKVQQGNLISGGEKKNGLYILSLESEIPSTYISEAHLTISQDIWH